MDLEQCKDYLGEFLDEKWPNINLKEQLESFKTYDFTQFPSKPSEHKDSTILAKVVYFIIWHTSKNNEYSLPSLSNWQEMEENYGGETINSFNSLFKESIKGAKKYIPETNTDFYEKVESFKELYLTIGNFMLLPLGKVGESTLNKKKGFDSKYKDYADFFLYDLFETSELDELKKANETYFKELSKEEFFKKNLLEDYLKDNHATIVFEHNYYEGQCSPIYWWKYENPQEHSEEYKSFALNYMEEASKIITNRADIMANILYHRLEK